MIGVGTIRFAVYEDDVEFLGVSNVQLPEKVQKVITINGTGTNGDVEIPIMGNYEPMTLTMTFPTYTESVAALREPRIHHIDLRSAQQNEDPVNGTNPVTSVKHVFAGVPKSVSGGTIAQSSSAEVTIAFSVRYWGMFVNGKKVDEIDQLSGVDIVNGINSSDPVQKALGK